MKAFLLAAGTGSRLRPITDRTPKCLVRVGGDCLLDLWLESFAAAGVREVSVNLHHLPDAVRSHLAGRDGPPSVRLTAEPVLLGSAGTLLANRGWVAEEAFFLVCNADNLTDFDLRTLVDAHRRATDMATIAVFHAEHPEACGVVEVAADGRMVGYQEKPAQPAGDLANAGMYAFDPRVLDALTGEAPLDIGYHLLPALVGHARVVEVDGYFLDVGTMDAYQRAQREWRAVAAS